MDQKLFGVNGRFLAGMALALSICLSFVLAPVDVSRAQGSAKTAAMGGDKSVNAYCSDETSDLQSGYQAPLSPAAYRKVSAPAKPPRIAVGAAAPGDERWSGKFYVGGLNDEVMALAVDGSGNVYAGGYFSTAGAVVANHIAKWDGSSWSSLGGGMDKEVFGLAVDGKGNLYAAGTFTTAGGVAAKGLAKWDGSSWFSLGVEATYSVNHLAVDKSGNLYASVSFTTAGGASIKGVAKWDGTSWSPLGSSTTSVSALAVDGNGNVYAGGTFTTAGGVPANRIAKWDGTSWSPLGSGLDDAVYDLAVDAVGNVYAGGCFTTAGGIAAAGVAKWDGSSWSPMGAYGAGSVVGDLVFDESGNLYADGSFKISGGSYANLIVKWDGTSWVDITAGMNAGAHALASDGAGNLYAGGYFNSVAGTEGPQYAVKWDGNSWSSLDAGGMGMNDFVMAFALDESGNVYAGGRFTVAGGITVNGIAKWDGNAWSALGSGVSGGYSGTGDTNSVHALALDGNGDLYAGGNFTIAGGVPANGIAKWDGSAWSPLGSGVTVLGHEGGRVYALAVDGSGNLYAGGYFTSAGGVTANGIAKWDGNAWSALGSGLDFNSSVDVLVFDGNGNLYAGSYYSSPAKWDGSTWSALGSGLTPAPPPPCGGCICDPPPPTLYTIASDGNGNVYAGGGFIAAGGVPANGVAKWDGSTWTPLGNSDPGAVVYSLAIDGTGNVYAGGYLSPGSGTAASHIGRWDGSAWSALGSGIDPIVDVLATDGAGNLYAGGEFRVAGGKSSQYIAMWDAATSILGSVTENGAPLPGVAINLTGAATKTATTDARGIYRFAGLANGAYTVTPNSGEHVFDPASRTVNYGGQAISGQDFAAAAGYSLSGSVKEGNAPVAGVTVRLSGAAAKTVFTGADGTYRFTGLLNGVYTVTPGKNLNTFSPGNRSLNVNGSEVSGQDFAAARKTGQPAVTISASAPNATEAGAKGAFKVTRSWSTNAPLTVKYTVGGSATSGTDYNALPGEVVIAANTLSAIIQVIPVNDAEIEGDETVTATLSTDPSYTVGSPNSATVKIADNDAVVTITALVPTATEWGTKGSFRVTRTGPTTSGLAVKYTVGGTATNGSDYNTLSGAVTVPAGKSFVNIAVTPVEDAGVEGMETVTATLSADPHYTVGSPDSATVKIVDNDAVVTITALFPNAKESGTKGLFQVIRTGPTTTGLVVKYTVGGTATNGVDYQQLSGSVIIYAGRSGNLIEVIPVNDTVQEGTETVVATLSANPYYTVGSPNSATVEIADND